MVGTLGTGKGREPGRAHAGSGPDVEQEPQAKTPGFSFQVL